MADDVPTPPNWDPSTPATNKFINPNPGANGAVFEIYASKDGEWHIYPNGQKEWVAGGENNVYQTLANQQAQQAAAAAQAVASTPSPAAAASAGGTAPASSSPTPPASSPSDDIPASPPIVSLEAAKSDGYYIQTNTSGDARNGQQYYTEESSDGKGYWNMYPASGQKEYVSGPLPASDSSMPLVTTSQGVVVGAPLSGGGGGSTGGGASSSIGATPGSGGASASGASTGGGGVDSNTGLTPGSGGASPGGGSTGSSGELTVEHQSVQPASPGGNAYTVQAGDTLGGIAEASGVSLGTLEDLNKSTIPNPDLIRPGESVNLGSASTPSASTVLSDSGGVPSGGSTGGTPIAPTTPISSPASSSDSGGTSPTPPTDDPSKPPASTPPDMKAHTPTSGFGGFGGLGSPFGASQGSAIGFPEKSTYPPVGDDTDKAGDMQLGTKAEGWVDGSGNGIPDVAKGVFEVDSHTSTDPLKIDERK